MKDIYDMYLRYNLWANRRLAHILRDLGESESDRDMGNSFPSLKKTVLHIWDAEQIWLHRLQGSSPDVFPSVHFTGTIRDACDGWVDTSRQFLSFVAGQKEDFLDETRSFRTITMGTYDQKVFEMIHHCMNHSTYHRGQLVTLARQLGLGNLPSTDLIFYLREQSAGKAGTE